MNISSSDENVALIRRHGSMMIESLKLALEWHQGDIGDEIFALRERLNMNDQGNFHREDNRHTLTRRFRLPSLSPQHRFQRLPFGLRTSSNESDLENGDLS
jgi:hypothetical protein